MAKFTHIEDPETLVMVFVYFKAGNQMAVKGRVKHAREALFQWKRFMIYYLAPVEKREGMEIPFALYHFMEGPEENPSSINAFCSFYMGDVCGMQYVEIPAEDEGKRKREDEYHQAMMGVMKVQKAILDKSLKEMKEGDDWRLPEGDTA